MGDGFLSTSHTAKEVGELGVTDRQPLVQLDRPCQVALRPGPDGLDARKQVLRAR